MKKIFRQIIFSRGIKKTIKIAGGFVIYWDKTLKEPPFISGDVPHYFDMIFESSSFEKKTSLTNYGYDLQKNHFLYKSDTVITAAIPQALTFRPETGCNYWV